jgi:hypothetical protein
MLLSHMTFAWQVLYEGLYHEINDVLKVRFMVSRILMWVSVFTLRSVFFFIRQITL